MYLLSIMLILSAIFGLSLHTNYLAQTKYIYKIPIFACLGSSIAFSLAVSIIDIINAVFHLIQDKDSSPPINATKQVIINPLITLDCSNYNSLLYNGLFIWIHFRCYGY